MSSDRSANRDGGGVEARVALVGYGLSGRYFHAPLIAVSQGLRLASVVTASPERRSQALQDFPGVITFDQVDDLWERAADHDLVVVASPTGTHLALGLAALEAGLPVVVDKPLAPTAVDARKLVAAATRRHLMLSVFHNRRWDGDTLTIKRLLAEDALGTVTRFESRFERWRPAVRESEWRENKPAVEGGGILLDLGSHVIDQALDLFGPAQRIYGEVDSRRPGAVADDDVFVAIEHLGGVRSHLWASAVAAIRGPRVKLSGLDGAYEKYGLDVQEDMLRAGLRPDDPNWGVDPQQSWGKLVTAEGERQVQTARGAWPSYYAAIARALQEGGPLPVTGESAVAALEVIEAARQGAKGTLR